MSDGASTRGWGPGWPNPDTSKIVKLNLPGFGNAQRVRQEIAPLVEWLIAETERRGYDIRPEWTWGFDNRPIRGSSKPSNHSWGLALDINAPTNGMNRAGPGWATQHAAGKTDMPEWLPELWESYGFRSGMNYTGRQDPMHQEFMGTPADAARYIAQITAPAPAPKDWLMALTDKQQTDLFGMVSDLHEQLIGKQTEAKDESLRQLIKESARDAKAAAQQTRPGKG